MCPSPLLLCCFCAVVIVVLAIKLWNMFYLLFQHFDPFLNLFPSFYVPSIQRKAEVIVECMSIYLSFSQKNIPIMF